VLRSLVSMSRGMKVRQSAAVVLLALFAAWWMAFLVGELLDLRRSPVWIHTGPPWVVQLQAALGLTVVLTTALALGRSWWWGRMASVSLALSALISAVISAADAAVPIVSQVGQVQIAWAVALLVCLRGPTFLAIYEGQQKGVDWRAPGMGALWWAMVLGGVTVVLLPLELIGAWQHWAGCFGTSYPSIDPQTSAYWLSLVLAALLLVGLVLLAFQKTAGLILTAVVSTVFPLVLMASLRGAFTAPDVRHVLLAPVPGLLAAWLALGFRAKAMWRLLRP
jgi:hypothetical protein